MLRTHRTRYQHADASCRLVCRTRVRGVERDHRLLPSVCSGTSAQFTRVVHAAHHRPRAPRLSTLRCDTTSSAYNRRTDRNTGLKQDVIAVAQACGAEGLKGGQGTSDAGPAEGPGLPSGLRPARVQCMHARRADGARSIPPNARPTHIRRRQACRRALSPGWQTSVNENCAPIAITTSKSKGAVLIGEDEWSAIEETLHLSNIPGMAKLIVEGMNTPLSDCIAEDDSEW